MSRTTHLAMNFSEEKIGNAILNREIGFAVQPIVDARSGDVVGAEALSRWNGLGPSDVSSDSSYLRHLCRLEHREPYRTVRLNQKLAIADRLRRRHVDLYINFAVEMLASDECWECIQSCIASESSRLSGIVVELSELNLFEVDQKALAKSWDRLQHLQSLAPALKFALDDFGKGASNFDRLRAWNIHAIKLDVSLIRDVDADKKAQKMLQHLNNMADEMNVSLIAEGVETQKEETALLELGINLQQGFFRGPPMAIDDLEASGSLRQF